MSASTAIKHHLLFVDDDHAVCESVEMLLGFHGYIVATAHSASRALELFIPGRFDVVFTDYLMPAMLGDELARAIKEAAPNQPVVMVTAFPEKFRSPERRLTGVDLLITKPFDIDTLRNAISWLAPGSS
jgi:CheY-like chemotaxis protein